MSQEQESFDVSGDRPIEKKAQDRLGRGAFAQKTAEAIARRYKRDSFVLALQGPWGSGKSSIKNMVLESLESLPDKPVVVDFAPWQLRDSAALFAAFFEEIALAIGQAGDGSEERKARLTSYSKYLSLGGSTLKSLGVLAGVLGVPLAKLVETLGEKVKDAGSIATEGAGAIEEKSLKQAKAELVESLRQLSRPVLVVIDDIDRLEVEEMLLIFQLVKANADFPNFTYLLLLQRETVEAALVDRIGSAGRDYLGKIIQLPIDVPAISDGQRRTLFLEGLFHVCQTWNVTLSPEQEKDIRLAWQNGLNGLLAHPRDVQRLLNALEFSGALLQGEAGWEVNVTDFVALEALRLQEPKVYSHLPGVERLLTGPKPSTKSEAAQRYGLGVGQNASGQSQEEVDPSRIEMDNLKALLSPERRNSAQSLLSFLFPSAEWAFPQLDQDRFWAKERRIHTRLHVKDERYFDRYFALTIAADQLSEAEIARTIALIPTANEFASSLEDLHERGLLWLFLLELSEKIERVPSMYLPTLLTTLLNYGERVPAEIGVFGSSIEHSAGNVFEATLQTQPDIGLRGEMFLAAIQNSDAVQFPVRWIWNEEVANKTPQVAGRANAWATVEKLSDIRLRIIERIQRKAQDGTLATLSRTQMVVRFWAETRKEEVTRWLDDQIKDEVGLRWFLNTFSSISYVIGGSPVPHDIRFDSDVLSWLTDLTSTKERVAALTFSEGDELSKVTAGRFVEGAEVFLEAQKPKDEGSVES